MSPLNLRRLVLALLVAAGTGCDEPTQVPEPRVEVVVCDNSVSLEKRLRESWVRWLDGRRITPCDEMTLREALVKVRETPGAPPPPPKNRK